MFGQHELILNHITAGEFMPPFRKDWETYKQRAYLFLNHKGKHLFESDILSQYREGVTLETLFKQNDEQYLQGANHEKDGIRQKTWYDIWSIEEIERSDDFFDYFFAVKLRHLSLLDIDEFLGFHLSYSFKDNKKEYFRFLQLTLRTYNEYLLNGSIVETVNEWIKDNEADKKEEPGFEKLIKIKGRIQREPNDHLTCLSKNQTGLLIEYMQKAGIILKIKEGSLNYKQAGEAFSILTGYSPDTLRTQIGTKETVEGVKYEDYDKLLEAVRHLASLIEADSRKK